MLGVPETGTSKDKERLYDERGKRSTPEQNQIPNDVPVSKRRQHGTRTMEHKYPASEKEKRGTMPGVQETGTSKDEEGLYDVIPDKRSIPEHYQKPNDVPVSKRHQNGTPKSADSSKENHYMALENYNVLKNDHYQKPKDISVPRFDYVNLGRDDAQTEV